MKKTMKEYIQEIIIPYVESIRDLSKCHSPAVCIIDNFKGQITPDIIALLEEKGIFVCKLPPNSTDILQPMDLSVNKSVKDYLRKEFSNWYSNEVSQQLNNSEDLQLQPVKLSLSSLKTIGAKWLVGMVDYIQDNPKIVVNGFRKSGILQALDEAYGNENEMEDTDEDFDDEDKDSSEIEDDENYEGDEEDYDNKDSGSEDETIIII